MENDDSCCIPLSAIMDAAEKITQFCESEKMDPLVVYCAFKELIPIFEKNYGIEKTIKMNVPPDEELN